MRSTTVGWLTSMLMVLPVTADNKWLNRARPECRDSINHPTEPRHRTPRSSPIRSANTTVAEDRADLGEWRPASGSGGILQGYHQTNCQSRANQHSPAPGSPARGVHWPEATRI